MPDPILTSYLASTKTRLLAKRRIAAGGCWEWTGYIDVQTGYGRVGFGNKATDHLYAKQKMASKGRVEWLHRVSWIVHFGAIPDEQCVLHRCDNRSCFNPSHLFLGTRKTNSDDKIAKGRYRGGYSCGDASPVAKLTSEQVEEIRKRYAVIKNIIKIAVEFSISKSQVWNIVSGKSWQRPSGNYVTTVK